jgi:hypothetical protein
MIRPVIIITNKLNNKFSVHQWETSSHLMMEKANSAVHCLAHIFEPILMDILSAK